MIKVAHMSEHKHNESKATPSALQLKRHNRSLTMRSGSRTRNYWLNVKDSSKIETEATKQAQKSIEHRDSYKAFLKRQAVLRRISAKNTRSTGSPVSDVSLSKRETFMTNYEKPEPTYYNMGRQFSKLEVLTPEVNRLHIDTSNLIGFTARSNSSRQERFFTSRADLYSESNKASLMSGRHLEEADIKKFSLLGVVLPTQSSKDFVRKSTLSSFYNSPYEARYFPRFKRETEALEFKGQKRPARKSLGSPNFDRLSSIKDKLRRGPSRAE
mmetsp:Transcript_13055/g.24394  ORF Transcript_13055/g.24394 Transcript_13055/m.24394 type:complete len:270 (+) Transcript_13055:1921-2730(+)